MVLPKIETYPLFRCVSGFIMDWIPYMYTVAKIPKTGVVLVMNLFVAVAFLAFGEIQLKRREKIDVLGFL